MNSKILLLSVAVISVGLFAMPSTLSLFAGQHTFYDGSNVDCRKCHQDIYDEMSGSGLYGTSSAHTSSSLKVCTGCHKAGTITNIPVNKSDWSVGGTGTFTQNMNTSRAHAAVTMECAGCHTGVPRELTNSTEAHGAYYNESVTNSTSSAGRNNGTLLEGGNEACVGCHSHTNVKIAWRRSIGMDMVVNESANGTYSIIMTANTSSNITTTTGGNVTAT